MGRPSLEIILNAPRIPPSPLLANRLCNDRPRKHRRDHRAGDHGTGDHGTGDHGTIDHGTGDHGTNDHGTVEWFFSLSLSLWQRVHYIEENESIRTFLTINEIRGENIQMEKEFFAWKETKASH